MVGEDDVEVRELNERSIEAHPHLWGEDSALCGDGRDLFPRVPPSEVNDTSLSAGTVARVLLELRSR